jgi:CBS domain-containing protein
MKAGDVMTLGAATVRPDASLAEAARLILEHRISGLPVVDDGGALVGIVTERDLLHGQEGKRPRWVELLNGPQAAAGDAKPNLGRVDEVMTANVVAVDPGTPIAAVLELLDRRKIRRVPVVAEGKVVGIVSIANLLLALTRRAGSLE